MFVVIWSLVLMYYEYFWTHTGVILTEALEYKACYFLISAFKCAYTYTWYYQIFFLQEMLITALEKELAKYDELLASVEAEKARKKLEEPEPLSEEEKPSIEEKQEEENSEDNSG